MSDQLLTAREVADLLGFAADTIVDWAEAGTVPAFKVGGRLRFRESEVLGWLETRRLNGRTQKESVSPFPLQAPGQRRILGESPFPYEGES